MRVPSGARRYAVHVTAVRRGDRWGVRLELTADTGVVVNRANVADLVFESAAEAEAAGWRLADDWISRLTSGREADDARPLASEERALLVGCDHAIARCHDCGLHHNFFELYGDRYCARCRADLGPAVRRHLRECDKILIRRAAAATEQSQAVLKENRRVRDAGDVARAEAEATRADARRTRARRPKPAGSVCRLCDAPLIPGQPVSFRQGALVHLACYQARVRGA
jgi:hypothetical protein